MSTTELRPLRVGEILDVAIKAYTKNARTLITIAAIVGVPFELLGGLIQLSSASSADQVGTFGANSNTSGANSNAAVAGLVLYILISFIVTLVVTAATVKAVSDAYLGQVPTVRDSLAFGLRRVRSLAWLYLVEGILLVGAVIALFLPALWLGIAWSVATPVLLIEDVRGFKALRRSFRLVRRRWWPTFAVQVMGFVIIGAATFLISGLLAVIPLAVDSSSVLLAVIASTISSALGVAFVQPVQGAITTILYFDLRVRREGLDVSLLAGRLGFPAPGVQAPAPRAAPAEPSPPAWPADGEDPFGRTRE